jgi:hypothetical protein
VLILCQIARLESLCPGSELFCHHAIFPCAAHQGVFPQFADEEHSRGSEYFSPGVISIPHRTTAINDAQHPIDQAGGHNRSIVKSGKLRFKLRDLEGFRFSVDTRELAAGQPPYGIEIVTVHLGQHPDACAGIARPPGRQARPPREGADYDWIANGAGLNLFLGGTEGWIEATHKANLQDHVCLAGCSNHCVPLVQR